MSDEPVEPNKTGRLQDHSADSRRTREHRNPAAETGGRSALGVQRLKRSAFGGVGRNVSACRRLGVSGVETKSLSAFRTFVFFVTFCSNALRYLLFYLFLPYRRAKTRICTMNTRKIITNG